MHFLKKLNLFFLLYFLKKFQSHKLYNKLNFLTYHNIRCFYFYDFYIYQIFMVLLQIIMLYCVNFLIDLKFYLFHHEHQFHHHHELNHHMFYKSILSNFRNESELYFSKICISNFHHLIYLQLRF